MMVNLSTMSYSRKIRICAGMLLMFVAAWGEAAPIEGGEPDFSASDLKPDLPPGESKIDAALPPEAAQAVALARAAFQNGKIDECLEHFRVAHASHTSLAPAKVSLAGLYLESGQYEPAQRLLEESAVSFPRHPEVFLYFGKLAVAQQRLTDADLQFRHALSLPAPANWSLQQRLWLKTHCLMGQTMIAQMRQDWASADRLLAELVTMHANDHSLREQWARALVERGRTDQAFEQVDILYRQDHSRQRPELAMAVFLFQQGEFETADRWFQTAETKYPNDAQVYFQRSVSLLSRDRDDQAKAQATRAAALGLDSIDLHLLRGLIAIYQSDLAAAQQHFTHLREQDPQHAEATAYLALALIEQGQQHKRQQALELAEAAAEQPSNSPDVSAVWGWVYYRLGQEAKAEQILREVWSQSPNSATTMFFLARVLQTQGNVDEARPIAQKLAAAVDRPGMFVFRPSVKAWLKHVPD